MIDQKFIFLAEYLMASEDQNLLRQDTLARILQTVYYQGVWKGRSHTTDIRELTYEKDRDNNA